MCRLLGILSSGETRPHAQLFESKYSLLRQAEVEGHKDGWGIGFYKYRRICLLARSTLPFAKDYHAAKVIADSYMSRCWLSFIRKASNPRNMDISRLINIESTQPFAYGRYMFAHNGTVKIPDQMNERLEGFKLKPASLNDSESYFIAFIKSLEENSGDAAAAFRGSEEFINTTYSRSKTKAEMPFSSLNAIFTDGRRMYAFNRYEYTGKGTVSDKAREVYKMCYRVEKGKALIASEPADGDPGWKDIGDGKVLEARVENGKVVCSIM